LTWSCRPEPDNRSRILDFRFGLLRIELPHPISLPFSCRDAHAGGLQSPSNPLATSPRQMISLFPSLPRGPIDPASEMA